MLCAMVRALRYRLKPIENSGFCGFDSLGKILAIKLYDSGRNSGDDMQFRRASVVTPKPANGGQGKTGQREEAGD
jgi:hypothetical protein